jgi:hypothetical protein
LKDDYLVEEMGVLGSPTRTQHQKTPKWMARNANIEQQKSKEPRSLVQLFKEQYIWVSN